MRNSYNPNVIIPITAAPTDSAALTGVWDTSKAWNVTAASHSNGPPANVLTRDCDTFWNAAVRGLFLSLSLVTMTHQASF